jgi:hypothetical protein
MKFTLRELFLITLIAALALGWFAHSRVLYVQIDIARHNRKVAERRLEDALNKFDAELTAARSGK